MARSLSALWFDGMRRIARKQQRETTRAVKKMLAAPKSRRARKRPAAAAPSLPLSFALAPPRPARAAPAVKKDRAPARSRGNPSPSRSRATAPLQRPPQRGSFTRGLFEPADPERGALHYWLYWPANAPASPRPLVVMLHGCGQTATEFAQGTRMNELAERKGFAVLYPQQSVTSEASRCWPWYTAQNQVGAGDAATLAELVRRIAQAQRVNRRRIYVAGISAGAAMAQILGLRHPELFAAVGMHSGPVFGTAKSKAQALGVMQNGDSVRFAQAIAAVAPRAAPIDLPAMILHGEDDKIVRPVNLMQVARQFLQLNGIDSTAVLPLLREYPARSRGAQPRHGYRTLSYSKDQTQRVVVCQIDGLEHAWSGGTGGLRYNSSLGPDASTLLWNFFARQRRRVAAL